MFVLPFPSSFIESHALSAYPYGVTDISAYQVLADGVVMLHRGFIIFVVLGGMLVFARPKILLLHIPCVIWASAVNIICIVLFPSAWDLVPQGMTGLGF